MGLFADWNGDFGSISSQHQDFARLRNNVGTMLGGIPGRSDVLPSALCICLYILLLVPAFWRLKRGDLNGHQAWRPTLVIFSRIVSFALRIKLSEGHDWDKDVFIAQLVLLRISPILLASALLSLFQDAIYPYLPRKEIPKHDRKLKWLLQHFVHLLQIGCYFAFGVTIAIAFDVRSALHGNLEARQKLHQSKEMLIYTLLAINVFLYALNIVPLVLLKQGRYEPRLANVPSKELSKFVCLMSLNTFLLVNSVFKTVQLLSPQMKTRTMLIINQKSLFWGICIAGEYIACALFVLIPWNRIVPLREVLEENLANMPPLHPPYPPPPCCESQEAHPRVPYQSESTSSSSSSSCPGDEEKFYKEEATHAPRGDVSVVRDTGTLHSSPEFATIHMGDPFEPLPPPAHNHFPSIHLNGFSTNSTTTTTSTDSRNQPIARPPPLYSNSGFPSSISQPTVAAAVTTPASDVSNTAVQMGPNRSSSLTLSTISEVGEKKKLALASTGSPPGPRALQSAAGRRESICSGGGPVVEGHGGSCSGSVGVGRAVPSRPWSAATTTSTASPVRRPTSTVDSLQSSVGSHWSDDSDVEGDKDDEAGKGKWKGNFFKRQRSSSFAASSEKERDREKEKEKEREKGRSSRRKS